MGDRVFFGPQTFGGMPIHLIDNSGDPFADGGTVNALWRDLYWRVKSWRWIATGNDGTYSATWDYISGQHRTVTREREIGLNGAGFVANLSSPSSGTGAANFATAWLFNDGTTSVDLDAIGSLDGSGNFVPSSYAEVFWDTNGETPPGTSAVWTPDLTDASKWTGLTFNDSDTVGGVSFTLTIQPEEYWPYANSLGNPVYDTATGAQLVDPLS